MAESLIGEVALWTALKTFCQAASRVPADPAGIPADRIYRALQNAPEMRGSPASVRLWSDGGAAALALNWQTQRSLLAERWRVELAEVEVGTPYAGEVLGVPFGYTAQPGDDLADVRDGLLAALPGTVDGAAAGAAALTVLAQLPGKPLALSIGPAELVTATRIRKTAQQLRWCPAEIIVQVEVVAERPRDQPDTVPSAMSYLGRILGKLAQDLGPVTDLEAAGLAFRRYAMQPEDLTSLDRAVNRSRARADLVFSVDVGDTMEFDRVAAYDPPTGEVSA